MLWEYFKGENDGFNKTMKLFTDVSQELTQEEYEKSQVCLVKHLIHLDEWKYLIPKQKRKKMKSLFKQAYT